MKGRTRTAAAVAAVMLGTVWLAGCDRSQVSAPTTSPAGADPGEEDGGGTAGESSGNAAKAVVIAWAKAVDAGDVAAAKAASDGDAEQVKALEAFVLRRRSEARLDAAITHAFPESANSDAAPEGLAAAVERARAKADGDAVTVWAYVEEAPLVARKQPDGEWKVALDHFTRDTETNSRMMARAHDALAADVKAGAYESAEAALDDLGAKIAEAAEALGVAPPPEPPGEAPGDATELD